MQQSNRFGYGFGAALDQRDLDMDLEEKMRTQATICKPNSEMRALLRLSFTQAIDITTLFNTVRTLGLLLQCHLFVALLSFS
jgi:hypothetical protein